VGASFDQPAKNALFKSNNNFQYPLWSDTGRELALAYGAATSKSQKNAKRITVILDPQGTWVLFYDVGFTFANHPQNVLDDMTAILSANP
jgi:peroxiredoxin